MNKAWIDLKLAVFRLRHFRQCKFIAEYRHACLPDLMNRMIPILYKRAVKEVTERRVWWLEHVRAGKFPEGMGNIK